MPLDMGAVISRAFSTIVSRIGSLLGLWAVFIALQIALSMLIFLILGAGVAATGNMMENPLAMGAGFIGGIILFYVMYLLLALAQQAALTHNASPALQPSFGDSFGAGLKAIPTLLGLLLLGIVAYFAAIIVLGIIGFVFSLMGDFGSVVFLLLIFVGAMYLYCRLAITLPVIVVDKVGNPITALQRSWQLTRGNALRIFLVMLLFTVIVGAIVLVLFAVMGGSFAGLVGAGGGGAESIAAAGLGLLIMFIVMILMMAFITIFASAFIASLHASLAGPEAVADAFS